MGCGASVPLPSPEAFLVPINDKDFKCLATIVACDAEPPQYKSNAWTQVFFQPQFQQRVLYHGKQDATIKGMDGSLLTLIEMRLDKKENRYFVINDGNRTPIAWVEGTYQSAQLLSSVPYFDNQAPSNNGRYAWANITRNMITNTMTMRMASGALLESKDIGLGSKSMAVTYIPVSGTATALVGGTATAVGHEGSGCCLVDFQRRLPDDLPAALKLAGQYGYAMTLTRGMDPFLMIALVAVRDGALGLPLPASGGGG